MVKIKIGNKLIEEGKPCFIIAEAGVNHNGSLSLGRKLVDVAKEAGVDAVKFQTFKAEKIVIPNAEQSRYQTENIGKKESQYAMLKRLELSYSDFKSLKGYCDKKGIIFLSTPHSCKEDVDLIAELCPAIKVGSGDLTNLPILKYIASKKLPIILSTGMSTLEEVQEAVKTIKKQGNNKIILLHCTTNYSCPLEEVNLRAMVALKKKFKLPVGYSDHTFGIMIPLMAVAMGAQIIEKHFTLNRNLPGPDHKASLEPNELKEMVKRIREAERALGDGIKKPTRSEEKIKKLVRKSIVARIDIPKGTRIIQDMLVTKRPGAGILPKYLNKIIGRIAKREIKKDELIKFENLK